MKYYTLYNSPVGVLTLASDGDNLIGLWIENQKYFMENINEDIKRNDNLEIFKEARIWLDRYFNKENPSIKSLKLKPQGTEFRKNVWSILCEIPYGKTITYKQIAKKLKDITGKEKMSAQAVGQAVGHNPISIIIPCHRVVGTNGSLTGYAGGIDVKKKLLEHENVNFKVQNLHFKY